MEDISKTENNLGILNDRYLLIELICDSSSSAEIYKVLDKNTDQIRVAKVFYENNTKEFEDENKILKSFDNKIPGVIAFFDSGEGLLYLKGEEIEAKRKYIILELAKRSVLDYRVEVDKFSEETYKYIFYQYILIIKELHKRGISHRDIKLENMLFTGDDYTLKFCDLGLSASFLDDSNKKKKLEGLNGSPHHYAPEILENKEYDGEKIDIFSAGATLFSLIKKEFAFLDARINDNIYRLIYNKYYKSFWRKVDEKNIFSPELKDLIVKMLAYKPDKRITLDEILDSDYLKVFKKEGKLEEYKNKMIKELNAITFEKNE